MTLTDDVKEELARVRVTRPQTKAAEVATLLRFAGGLHVISSRVAVESELDSAAVARRRPERGAVEQGARETQSHRRDGAVFQKLSSVDVHGESPSSAGSRASRAGATRRLAPSLR